MTKNSDLRRELIDQEPFNDPESRARRKERMRILLERERTFVTRLKKIAIAAWGLSLLFPLSVALYWFAHLVAYQYANETSGFGLMLTAYVLGAFSLLCLMVAIITTAGWFFRSRTSTLAAIEMRLGELEELIRQESAGENR